MTTTAQGWVLLGILGVLSTGMVTVAGLAFAGLRSEMSARFAAADARFDAVDTRFDGVDVRFDGVDKRLDGVDKRLDSLDRAVQGLTDRFFRDRP